MNGLFFWYCDKIYAKAVKYCRRNVSTRALYLFLRTGNAVYFCEALYFSQFHDRETLFLRREIYTLPRLIQNLTIFGKINLGEIPQISKILRKTKEKGSSFEKNLPKTLYFYGSASLCKSSPAVPDPPIKNGTRRSRRNGSSDSMKNFRLSPQTWRPHTHRDQTEPDLRPVRQLPRT